jgi:hypothetical protein
MKIGTAFSAVVKLSRVDRQPSRTVLVTVTTALERSGKWSLGSPMTRRSDLDMHYAYQCRRLEKMNAEPLVSPEITDVLSDGELTALVKETSMLLVRLSRASRELDP